MSTDVNAEQWREIENFWEQVDEYRWYLWLLTIVPLTPLTWSRTFRLKLKNTMHCVLQASVAIWPPSGTPCKGHHCDITPRHSTWQPEAVPWKRGFNFLTSNALSERSESSWKSSSNRLYHIKRQWKLDGWYEWSSSTSSTMGGQVMFNDARVIHVSLPNAVLNGKPETVHPGHSKS